MAGTRTLRLSPSLDPGQQAFQLATQIGHSGTGRGDPRVVDKQIHQRRIARASPASGSQTISPVR